MDVQGNGSMRFASFVTAAGNLGFGIVESDEVLDISTALGLMPDGRGLAWALQVFGGVGRLWDIAHSGADVKRHALGDVRLLPPVTDPERILCIGLNFFDHAAEAKLPVPSQPSMFVRFPSSFVGHGADIIAPSISEEFDFEGELALVMGSPGYRIPAERALEHVLGVTVLTDNSARDWQRHSRQVTAGKNFPHSGGIGPWCVTLDEGIDLRALSIITRLNGATVQRGSTADLIFSAEEAIAYVSSFTPLSAGDILALGTPAGVGMARTPPLWMKPGDLLEVEVPGIGTLSNRVAAEADTRTIAASDIPARRIHEGHPA